MTPFDTTFLTTTLTATKTWRASLKLAKGVNSCELSQSYHERWRPEECKRDKTLNTTRGLWIKGVKKWTVRLKTPPYMKEQKPSSWSGGFCYHKSFVRKALPGHLIRDKTKDLYTIYKRDSKSACLPSLY